MPCEPPVKSIRFGEEKDEAVAQRLKALFQEDQASRRSEPTDWDTLHAEDRQRRSEVIQYLQQARVKRPRITLLCRFHIFNMAIAQTITS